ncbi:aspartate/glutamate racemase family protein [Billgrantia tianxiuensis]|jgi:aspartate racemase|uniref:Aspartate/glutamate racemase family protein n=1 Tax=Billgrantia tianxiuensis TaxID=2497861 RepID=A0A6I6SUE0_9GAMM|nr:MULTISPECIES: amino acid racemase [Halomonas]MCE8035764.1 aspartate/glutamate racemase family protein [Halomonas sp. MCCC 1A11057]QHC50663.1 aspartate/glutamate racemase family protein [Halomonas tianxiuensis]
MRREVSGCSSSVRPVVRYGVVGGLGALGSADVLIKTVRAAQNCKPTGGVDIAFEQRHFDDGPGIADEDYNPIRRKFYVYDVLKGMQGKVENALVPCFLSHTFLSEITPEISYNVVDIFDALLDHIRGKYPEARKIGVLTSSYVRASCLFEQRFEGCAEIVYPDQVVQRDALMQAIYGPSGIKSGHHGSGCLQLLLETCDNLVTKGADIIVPGLSEIPVLMASLQSLTPVPLLDSNLIYAEYALGHDRERERHSFKLGVLGGVGPAATVDFMRKVVSLTRAERDQDHLKIVVEQNPQIPDRTANLIGNGEDPSIPMLATCQRLEAEGANAIAIPCNTAHAFVARIQPYIGIPIINMLTAVVDHLGAGNESFTRVGLLATSGTVESRVYHDIMSSSGRETLVPAPEFQARVMEAIYGSRGVKAGYVSGECSEHLHAAIDHLLENGAEVIILGCTELPLIELDPVRCQHVTLLDPTEILAHSCVALAQ